NSLSSIYLGLSDASIALYDYKEAEKYIKQGTALAKELLDEKLIYDFTLTKYALEKKQGNYKTALENLELVHSRDSIYYNENVSNILSLHEEQQKSLEKEQEYKLQLEKREKHTIVMFFAVIVAALCIAVIVILNKSKRKAERNNIRLQKLNEEISVQKENLNKMNLKLEDIIAERTKDLISKNQKLSEYSSHLSHQIRGPVATLKGLIMLAEDELINEREYIKQMKKCVDDIDSQIMDINIALHDASRKGLNKEDK
uniref:histidine kinase dimerization/phospho-acceptor domain-containing protein n=1 Tax=Pseudopedobacter sp. TaxID=1936787 RepID=UPI00334174C0